MSYRLHWHPDAEPLAAPADSLLGQLRDVEAALRVAVAKWPRHDLDVTRFVTMGISAGTRLASRVTLNPEQRARLQRVGVIGYVGLDGGGHDLDALLRVKPRLEAAASDTAREIRELSTITDIGRGSPALCPAALLVLRPEGGEGAPPEATAHVTIARRFRDALVAAGVAASSYRPAPGYDHAELDAAVGSTCPENAALTSAVAAFLAKVKGSA